jgi:endonuclease III
LIVTVMSQHTSDVNRDRAYGRLRQRFPSWEQVLDAPVEEVADAIRPGGIADVKARRIQEILGEIERRESRLDLDRLNELADAEVVDYLCSLPGVGPKTAACVLLFAMGREAFPVDTHVHRVVTRLGLAPPGGAEAAHRLLEPAIPPELRYEFHVQLIRHGREICKPRMPLCSHCVLFDLCEAGPSLVASGAAR